VEAEDLFTLCYNVVTVIHPKFCHLAPFHKLEEMRSGDEGLVFPFQIK